MSIKFKSLIIRLLFILILLPFAAAPAYADNVIRVAKEAIKKNQRLSETAQNLIAEAAKPETRQRDRVECYRLAAECHLHIHLQENTKLYLQQKYDTAVFFSSLLEVFRFSEMADSTAAQPDEKGKVSKVNYRRTREYLKPYRQNLLNGGKWQFMRRHSAEAYAFFNAYLHVADMPAFAEERLLETDPQMREVAFLAAYMAYETGRNDDVIRHAPLAKQAEGRNVEFIQEFLCRAYLAKGDTLRAVSAMHEGLNKWPGHEFFISRLLDYYADSEQFDRGLAVADSMLTVDDRKPLYWYARSLFLLKKHEDSKAVVACDRCIELDSTFADAYYNKAIATLNKAVEFARTACTDLTNPQCVRDREVLQGLYQHAKEPMERFRQLRPDDSARWAAPLYRIYLNLNMGREFDEIDRIMKDKGL
ncbi:MAG: hypothetical protein J5486_09945 [Bacteroidaceae bacterium]|nr:hypothetical protein [Bacteroidaceae bacterium]